MSLTRRAFLGAGLALGLVPHGRAARMAPRLVVVGGGFGGATAARTLKRLMPSARVTLVEPNARYVSCPFSNLVVAGMRSMDEQTFGYDVLRQEGVNVVTDLAIRVDANAHRISLASGSSLPYDRLVMAPGIDFRWEALAGYTPETAEKMPHAWKAGPQTTLLRRQLEAMADGDVAVISVTAAPFRCPPGPYERASLIARYLQRAKPRSKLIILDSNNRFSKQELFIDAWQRHYGDLIEWRSAFDDGRVRRVDAGSMTVSTDFEELRASVINIVPPQKAAAIAARAGCTDVTGWCPIDPVTFESTLVPDIHVIGDATIAAPMPKSAFSANAQAKVCAIQIARLLSGLDEAPTTLANTCYSYVTEEEAISIAGVYHNDSGAFTSVTGAGGVSPLEASSGLRVREGRQATDWFQAITAETFGQIRQSG